ncbi:MAG: FkbM family methyltransferase [Candidatus Dojkabacteria bacterium]
MIPQTRKIKNFSITYLCKEELDILQKEIFSNEIYSINLKSSKPKIYDLGSHIGLSILYFKTKYPNSEIVAFEPNPNVFHILEENIEGNGIKDVILRNLALGKKDSTRKLYIDSTGYGAFSTASFTKNAWNGKQKTIPIDVETKQLSKFLSKDIDLLKMDIEGEELNILEELEESNKLKDVENILMEYHPKEKSQFKRIKNMLEKNNFELKYRYEGKEIEKPIEDLILIVAKQRSKES